MKNSPIAYFDLDDTLLAGDSISYWNRFLLKKRPWMRRFRWIPWVGLALYASKIASIHTLKRFLLAPTSFIRPHRREELAEQFVREELIKHIYPEMVERMWLHKLQGHKVVVVSASADFYLQYLQMWLPIDRIIGTPMEFPESGFMRLPKYERGNFKGEAKVDFLKEDPDLPKDGAGAYGYSDHHSDSFLLNYTETPIAVHPNAKLKDEALEKNWPILAPFRRRHGKRRLLEKARLLFFAKGSPENRLSPNVGNRAMGVKAWAQIFQQALVDDEFLMAKRQALRLKGIPQALLLTKMTLKKEKAADFLGVFASYKGTGYSVGKVNLGRVVLNSFYSYWFVFSESKWLWHRELVNGAKPTQNLDLQFLRYFFQEDPLVLSFLSILEESTGHELYENSYNSWFQNCENLLEGSSIVFGSLISKTRESTRIEQIPHQSLSLFQIEFWSKWNPQIKLRDVLLKAFAECLQQELLLNISWGQYIGWTGNALTILDVSALKKLPKGIGSELSAPANGSDVFESYLHSFEDKGLPFQCKSNEELIRTLFSPLYTGEFESWIFVKETASAWEELMDFSTLIQEMVFHLYQLYYLELIAGGQSEHS